MTERERIANVGAGVTPTYHATESVEEAKAVVGQCGTATDELRRLLDERWVEHTDTRLSTLWLYDEEGYLACVDEGDSTLVHLHWWCTPEQAIEATLGRGECSVQEVPSGVGWVELQCSMCGCNRIDRHDNFCPNCGRKVVQE